ncbi:prepilin-type N-terminal cleavage/methylation domain-containing protein [Nocardioides nematodiphilus]|uniref:prepilin-type N-terminal cleavage/methylation domain-containing protein n=1 Tax=Nocardioides nematodiphilus TaxID=2849669 RepID=UPI001CD9D68B|nr:prepilin-type N-terminal cleavage/methylation domain-containing protein [Nocardioides nematodiphilus]MCA1981272.1 prepilin-type N-terminal cleavage/methylation domain-containing protein [Nocardioides nematodiphilus]
MPRVARTAGIAPDRPDAGFTLVEVVIAMMLLAILALATLPMLLQGVRASSASVVRATATRQVSALLEQARATPSCRNLAGLQANRTPYPATSPTMELVLTLAGPCTAQFTASVTVWAVRVGTDPARCVHPLPDGCLATASTLIYMTG